METWNGNYVPSNLDMWNLVADMQKLAIQDNRVIPVSSKSERDALADAAPAGVVPNGTVVLRMDQSTAGPVFDTMVGSVWIEGDTGWTNFTFASGFKQQGTQPNRFRRVGREVKIEIGVTGTTDVLPIGGTSQPFTNVLPTVGGLRPLVSPKYYLAPTNSLDLIARVFVGLDGRVNINTRGGSTATGYVAGIFSWFSE